MTVSRKLESLRKRHYALEALPAVVRVSDAEMAVEDTTLDDIAFAMLGVEAEYNAVGDRYHALRKLYALARQAGAVGADRIVDAVATTKEGA